MPTPVASRRFSSARTGMKPLIHRESVIACFWSYRTFQWCIWDRSLQLGVCELSWWRGVTNVRYRGNRVIRSVQECHVTQNLSSISSFTMHHGTVFSTTVIYIHNIYLHLHSAEIIKIFSPRRENSYPWEPSLQWKWDRTFCWDPGQPRIAQISDVISKP